MASPHSSVPPLGMTGTAPKKATMKRTTTAPWTAAVQGNRASGNTSPMDRAGASPRVSSDIASPRSPSTPTHGATKVAVPKPSGLSHSAKLQELQKKWERERGREPTKVVPSLGGQTPREPRSDSGTGANVTGGAITSNGVSKPIVASPVPLPTYASSAKRPAPELDEPQDGPLTKRQHVESASTKPPTDQGSSELQHHVDKMARDAEAVRASNKVPAEKNDRGRNLPVEVIVNGQTYKVIEWAGDRRYLDYYADNSAMPESSCGALLPIGYRTLPEAIARFICPVHNCRKRLDTIHALGGHFAQTHRRRAFNDNKCGTISEIGFYNFEDFAKGPAVIISQNELPPGAPAPAEPTMSVANIQRAARLSTGTGTGTSTIRLDMSDSERSKEPELADLMSLTAPGASTVPAVAPVPADTSSEVLAYLHGFLREGHTVPKREDIAYMLQLKPLRELPGEWLAEHAGSMELDVKFYACALAYLVGDEVQGSDKCMQAENNKNRSTCRLSACCIALPSFMPKELKEIFSKVTTCVGCRYWAHLQRQSNPCDWNPNRRQPGTKPRRGANRKSSIYDETGTGSDEMPRSPRSGSEDVGQVSKPTLPPPSLPAPQMFDDTMDDWEEAPGRLLVETATEPLGIAYSNIYTTSEQSVDIANDIGFNRVRLHPGKSHSWPADSHKIRSCEVVAGKIDCKIGDQSFTLGHGGLFVIHPGKECMIRNHRYFEAGKKMATQALESSSQPTPSDDSPSSITKTHTKDLPTDKSASGVSEESERATRFIKDPDGDETHDQTTVDIITVPCPGGDALRSWNRDGLLGRYFGAPAMRDAEGASGNLQGASWVRQGIRREANVARILLYEHPVLEEGTTIGDLADALLEDLRATRDESANGQRPIVFIAHSLGGLVVKMLLAKASRDNRFEDILRDCYGVAFFGTPHQGSSYFSMPSLAPSIQSLLQLKQPLPLSITVDLRPGNSLLLRADEAFKDIAHDLRVWTLYETIDSRLSSSSSSARGDEDRDKKDNLYFTATLASIKSAIMGMRQERIFPLQSDHANVASFGRHNAHTLKLFLRQLAGLIGRADASVRDDKNSGAKWSLNLEQKVGVEVHGFFDDATIGHDPVIRAWSTKLPLKEFLIKGPEECLRERLSEVEDVPDERQFLRNRGRTMSMTEAENDRVRREAAAREGLGIRNQLLQSSTPPISPVLRPVDASPGSAPEIVPTYQQHQQIRRLSSPPPPPTAAYYRVPTPSRRSTPVRRPSPLIRADLEQEAIIDRLSPPLRPRSVGSLGRSISDQSSPGEYRNFPPFLPASLSSAGNEAHHGAADDNDDIDSSTQLPEAVVAIRKSVNSGQIKPPDTAVTDEAPVCFARPDVSQRKRASISPPPASPSMEDAISLCLFLPYLHFDSYKRLIHRRSLILQRLTRGRARPVPDSVAKLDSLEEQVVWEFLGHDPPINCRRTLDQFGYPSLRDTRGRDDDQMLYKLTKERENRYGEHQRDMYAQSLNSRSASYGSHRSWRERLAGLDDLQAEQEPEDDTIRNGNVLMVDQLWLWVMHSHTLLSFFPKRESDPIEGPLYQQADLRDSIFNEVNVDLTRQCENALDLAALSALHAVSVLLDRASHPDLEIFRIFEEAISVLTEKLTNSLKAFRLEGFRDKASAYEPVENKERSIRARHKEEGHRAERENRDNTSALLELRDLEDELLVLLQLFDRQYAVLSSMLTAYDSPALRDKTARGRGFIAEAIRRVGEYRHRADEMIVRVRATRDDYDKLLQMVQRQAQVDEVRLSRLHADLASAQSRSVMIFTVFTVIFLPLTFFTGLFGMNTREWEAETPTLGFIGYVSLPASFVLVLVSFMTAFSTHTRKVVQAIRSWVYHWLRAAHDHTLGPAVEAYRQRQYEAQRKKNKGGRGKEDGRRGLKNEASDFWERHRLEREQGYQIPEVNRRVVPGRKTGKKKDSRTR
ncbi:uncharacterized protein F5Z01DRAFT_682702 [Emericellopsis atlantica]|uniref:DUF676 domain-containing protein n=1 Tax=Emericellopsis atlantica TaxID=2614577 RepID=A0A9P7ZI91_9HYPO|nr:uncharacterized protein F5Z01DRAFT_682702 [Emericellopsis atlantica]KAG9252182.1 hypothetical protein F5Z01DRAFT_682702 [Emericellopsis atlantica]